MTTGSFHTDFDHIGGLHGHEPAPASLVPGMTRWRAALCSGSDSSLRIIDLFEPGRDLEIYESQEQALERLENPLPRCCDDVEPATLLSAR